MILNIGCGKKIINSALNVDINPLAVGVFGCDVINEYRRLSDKMLDVSKRSGKLFSQVVMRHFIEHLSVNQAMNLLYQLSTHPSVSNNCLLLITTPNFKAIVDAYQNHDLSLEYMWPIIFGWMANKGERESELYMFHKVLYDPATIKDTLIASGWGRDIAVYPENQGPFKVPSVAMEVTCAVAK